MLSYQLLLAHYLNSTNWMQSRSAAEQNAAEAPGASTGSANEAVLTKINTEGQINPFIVTQPASWFERFKVRAPYSSPRVVYRVVSCRAGIQYDTPNDELKHITNAKWALKARDYGRIQLRSAWRKFAFSSSGDIFALSKRQNKMQKRDGSPINKFLIDYRRHNANAYQAVICANPVLPLSLRDLIVAIFG